MFENPSDFTLRKMKELIGRKIYRNGEEGTVINVDYSENVYFGMIDGYCIHVDFGRSAEQFPGNISWLRYPISFKHWDIPSSGLPAEFIEDVITGLKRIEDFESLNTEKLKSVVAVPVEDRIIQRTSETSEYPLFRLFTDISPAFMGSCTALFNIGAMGGNIRLTMDTLSLRSYQVHEVARRLHRTEVDDFYALYRKFDFLAHERSIDRQGLDGISLHSVFYDGNVYRFYHCWCPEEGEVEFDLVKYLYRFFRECFTSDEAQDDLDKIRGYFHCNEVF